MAARYLFIFYLRLLADEAVRVCVCVSVLLTIATFVIYIQLISRDVIQKIQITEFNVQYHLSGIQQTINNKR